MTLQASRNVGILDSIVDYCTTAPGASDTIDALCYGAQYAAYLPLSPSKLQAARGISNALDGAGSTFYFFDTCADGARLYQSSAELLHSCTQRNVRQVAYDACTLAADTAESAKHVLSTIGRAVPSPLKVLICSAWLATDVADLYHEVKHLSSTRIAPSLVSGNQTDLVLLKLVKTISSLAMDILGLAAVAFIAVTSAPLTTHSFLLLSTIFLIMNVSIHFLNQSLLSQEHAHRSI
jgi:hypothetical protein